MMALSGRKCAAALVALVAGTFPGEADAAGERYPVSGELIVSELMISPDFHSSSSNTHEWIELYSRGTQDLRLDGCLLLEYNTNLSGTCTINDVPVPGKCYTLPLSGVPTLIKPSKFRVLATSAENLLNHCGLTDVVDYNSITLNDTGVSEDLSLYCPDAGGVQKEVFKQSYQWSTIIGAETGQSWMLHQDALQEGDPSNPRNWCMAPTDASACTYNDGSDTYQEYGTPGAGNVCPVIPARRYPTQGDVILSELNIFPTGDTGSPEWVELEVLSAPVIEGEPAVDLVGCELRSVACDDLGATRASDCLAVESPTFPKTSVLTAPGDSYPLTGGERVLASRTLPSSCAAVDPQDSQSCVAPAEMTYPSVVLDNGELRMLELSCPDEEGDLQRIDRVVFDQDEVENQCRQDEGRCSWELRPESHTAELNDDPLNWGAAPRSAEYVAADSDDGPLSAFGTPGSENKIGPRIYTSPIRPGDLLITELAIWPTTSTKSPDWLELVVLNAPALDAYDLGQCVLRTVACADSSAECIETEVPENGWKLSDTIEPTGDDLVLTDAGSYLTLAASSSRTCVSWAEDGITCQTFAFGHFSFGSTGLSNSETSLLELACRDESQVLQPIDRVVFAKSWVELTCSRPDEKCSWELRPESAASLAGGTPDNDDPKSWVASPVTYLEPASETANGTPALPNGASAKTLTGRAPLQGEVAFSELMIAPPETVPEWIELRGVADDGGLPLELAGCQILRHSGAEEATCTPSAPESCTQDVFPTVVSLPFAAGAYALLVKGDVCVSYGVGGETSGSACEIPASLSYSKVALSNEEEMELALWCPAESEDDEGEGDEGEGDEGEAAAGSMWTLIDRFRIDWRDFSARCSSGAGEDVESCSVAIQPSHTDTTGNDDPFYRCVTPPETFFYDTAGLKSAGTPGTMNVCPALADPPPPGSVIFSELMISPRNYSDDASGNPFVNEWFELYNLDSTEYGFETCRLVIGDALEDRSLNEVSAHRYSQATNPARIQGETYQVWAPAGCVVGDDEGCGFGEEDYLPDRYFPADAAYSSLGLTDSGPHILQLECDGPGGDSWVVDSVWFDFEVQQLVEGHSIQLMEAFFSADANDDPANWCMSSFWDKFWETDQGCNYGTPGEANVCSERPAFDGEVGPSCRCDVSPASRPEGFGMAAALSGLLLTTLLCRRSVVGSASRTHR